MSHDSEDAVTRRAETFREPSRDVAGIKYSGILKLHWKRYYGYDFPFANQRFPPKRWFTPKRFPSRSLFYTPGEISCSRMWTFFHIVIYSFVSSAPTWAAAALLFPGRASVLQVGIFMLALPLWSVIVTILYWMLEFWVQAYCVEGDYSCCCFPTTILETGVRIHLAENRSCCCARAEDRCGQVLWQVARKWKFHGLICLGFRSFFFFFFLLSWVLADFGLGPPCLVDKMIYPDSGISCEPASRFYCSNGTSMVEYPTIQGYLALLGRRECHLVNSNNILPTVVSLAKFFIAVVGLFPRIGLLCCDDAFEKSPIDKWKGQVLIKSRFAGRLKALGRLKLDIVFPFNPLFPSRGIDSLKKFLAGLDDGEILESIRKRRGYVEKARGFLKRDSFLDEVQELWRRDANAYSTYDVAMISTLYFAEDLEVPFGPVLQSAGKGRGSTNCTCCVCCQAFFAIFGAQLIYSRQNTKNRDSCWNCCLQWVSWPILSIPRLVLWFLLISICSQTILLVFEWTTTCAAVCTHLTIATLILGTWVIWISILAWNATETFSPEIRRIKAFVGKGSKNVWILGCLGNPMGLCFLFCLGGMLFGTRTFWNSLFLPNSIKCLRKTIFESRENPNDFSAADFRDWFYAKGGFSDADVGMTRDEAIGVFRTLLTQCKIWLARVSEEPNLESKFEILRFVIDGFECLAWFMYDDHQEREFRLTQSDFVDTGHAQLIAEFKESRRECEERFQECIRIWLNPDPPPTIVNANVALVEVGGVI